MTAEEPKLSIYKNAKDNTGSYTTPGEVLSYIFNGDTPKKKGQLAAEIAAIRKEKNAGKRYELKKKLYAVTWSGIFTRRAKEGLHKHSGLICIDIDKLSKPRLKELFPMMQADKYVYSAFVSPSGNGLKIIFKIALAGRAEPSVHAIHELYFNAIKKYLSYTYGIEADPSGKDVSRLCFLSHSPGMFMKDEAILIAAEQMKEFQNLVVSEAEPPGAGISNQNSEISIQSDLANIRQFTDKIKKYEPGHQNAYTNQFVNNCKLKGIPKEDCEAYCLREFNAPDWKDGDKTLKAIVKSVYANSKIVFGKYAKAGYGERSRTTGKQGKGIQSSLIGEGLTEYNDTIKFWYDQETVNQKNGEVTSEVKFDHDKITYFLANNGFKKIEIGEGFQFIRIKDNKLEPVNAAKITSFILTYLSQNLKTDEHGNYVDVEDALYLVRKMFKRGMKTYCSEQAFQSLPLFTPNLVRDTEHTAYLYFNNCYVEINKEGIVTRPYTELKGQIWKKQIIQRDFTKLDRFEFADSVFQKFVELAVVGDIKEYTDRDIQKFKAAATGIGYQIHRYKDPTNTKAVVAVDKKLRHSNESNGGSGKSLYFKAISKIIHSCSINGKSFKFDSQYPFGTLQVDHGLVVFNDVKKSFDFEELFHYITEDWDFRRLYENAIVMPFEDSPKIGVATNFSLKGNGDSFLRRQHIIEFSNYFNATHDPLKKFGHRFFTQWDEKEWNKFDNFMLACVCMFLKDGLIDSPLENYGINKLIDSMGEEGVDWLNDNINNEEDCLMRIGIKLDKSEVYKKFKIDLPRYANLKPNTFTGWVKEWARIKSYELNAHKPGDGIDKSGSTYYWTFTIPPKTP